jgi:hypothetical protein
VKVTRTWRERMGHYIKVLAKIEANLTFFASSTHPLGCLPKALAGS